MAAFRRGTPVVTDTATVTVDAGLPTGVHRFQLVVVDDAGNVSRPAELSVEVRAPAPPVPFPPPGPTLPRPVPIPRPPLPPVAGPLAVPAPAPASPAPRPGTRSPTQRSGRSTP